jgi:hypothetical protein
MIPPVASAGLNRDQRLSGGLPCSNQRTCSGLIGALNFCLSMLTCIGFAFDGLSNVHTRRCCLPRVAAELPEGLPEVVVFPGSTIDGKSEKFFSIASSIGPPLETVIFIAHNQP